MTALTTETINDWADNRRGPVALTCKQKLVSVEGENGVIFPPTYADIGYNIDTLSDGTKVATIDSVGSQANRIEPIFKAAKQSEPENPLSKLVPQIDITYGNEKTVSIFDTGHRLGDAVIRSSELKDDAQTAFKLFLDTNDASALAKLAPTSLVFGVWDSRDTHAKLPRIVQSVIRAWDVDVLHRAATYIPPVDYTSDELLGPHNDSQSKDARSKGGFQHAPATWTNNEKIQQYRDNKPNDDRRIPGGVVVRGAIERTVTVNLLALHKLHGENTQTLRRYLLGLALMAATEPLDGFLRQGCLLVNDAKAPGEWVTVARDGVRTPVALSTTIALDYARAAALKFGVGPNRKVAFKKELAKAELKKPDKLEGK